MGTILKKGIYKNLSNEDYHANRTHLSSSVLKTALEDPVEYRRVYVEGKPKKKMGNQSALDLGNYMHTLLLEPELLEKECAVYPARQRRGKAWEFFKHQNKDKTIITQAQLEVAEHIHEEFKKTEIQLEHGKIKGPDLFTGGEAELSLFLDLEFPLNESNKELADGEEFAKLPVKIRTDYFIHMGDHFLTRDLKTTSKCPNDVKTAKQICYDYYYFLSAALYLDSLRQYHGMEGKFELVFSSKTDFLTNLYRVGQKSLNFGRGQYISALNSIWYWRKTGNYPQGTVREL